MTISTAPRSNLTLVFSLLLAIGQVAEAEPRTSIRQTSVNHTEIVIHDTSPEAYQTRRAQAERAQKRLDEKRERRRAEADQARRRDRELRELTLKHKRQRRAQVQKASQFSGRRNKRASFFNGGRPTITPWYGSGFGFPYSFNGSYPINSFGPVRRSRCRYRPRYRSRGCQPIRRRRCR